MGNKKAKSGKKTQKKSPSKTSAKKTSQKEFDKYWYYERTVQCVENDIDFINQEYQHFYRKKPKTIREDFGGTAKLCCEWVTQGSDYKAWAIDFDPEPQDYGKKHHLSVLKPEQQKRVIYQEGDVLETKQKAQVIVAFNFSYFIFKKRSQLLEYFKGVRKSLPKDGLFMLDLFGGPESSTLLEEETEYDNYSYYWDCDHFNPINHDAIFKIHFKLKGEKKRKDVFTYHWRLWSLPELRDLLEEAGFSRTVAYWEEDDEDDDGGNGVFYRTEEAENCESWVTYLAAIP